MFYIESEHKAFLRSTSNISATGRYMINLPKDILKKIGWTINDNLHIDIKKNKEIYVLRIRKELE